MDPHYPKLHQLYRMKIAKARGTEHVEYVVDVDLICAVLIVSLQHLLVMVLPPKFGEAVDNGDSR
eukprot:281532-Ditylum_brightwellii.AAC.1